MFLKSVFSVHDPVLPTYYPGSLVRWLVSEGYDELKLLKGTGLSPDCMHQEEARISFAQHKPLLTNAMRLTRNPHLGVYFGQQLSLTSMGIVGYAAMACSTLGEALETIVRFFSLRAPLLKPRLRYEQGSAVLAIDEALDYGEIRHFIYLAAFSSFGRIFEFVASQSRESLRAKVSYTEPADWRKHQDVLGFPILFDEDECALILPAEMLEQPLGTADPVTAETARKICEAQLTALGPKQGLVSRIRSEVLDQPGVFPTLEQMAERLCISSRSLRRELQGLGTSYQKQLDEIRKQLAVGYLNSTGLTIAEISELCGFKDPSNFGRAFRAWTGRAPSHYRKAGLL